MKKNYFAAAFLLAATLSSTAARAQADFRPGYIMRPAGDTVRGDIDYRGAHRGGQQCLFRPAAGATATWLPAQLRGYGLASGEHFISQLTPMPAVAPVAAAPRQLFLEVLADGPASLLLWRDETGQEHFYVQKMGAPLPTELVQVRQRVLEGNISREQVLPVFRGTLTEQFADCPAVLLSMSKTEYKASALVAAVERYNACREPNRLAKVHQSRTATDLEIVVGGQASRTMFTTPTADATLPAGLAPEVGVALQLGRRVLRQKLAVRAELHYARQVAEGSYQQQEYQPGGGLTITQHYDLRFTTAYLRVPVLIRYTMPGKKLRPFVEVGGSFNYAITIDPQVRSTASNGTSTDWYTLFSNQQFLANSFRNYEFGLLAGVGLQLPAGLAGHTISLLGRAERSDGFMRVVSYSTPVVRGSVLVSFDLTKAR
ncbi:outer membrane beta-barrel protein [Hymenobacter sp. HMF4947]|uniref:Outer membrane beta-barrel protein n=1 Tax=Hymenobacter ginkgonis TaxID=2682976 RepID=A0A7K1TH04_9BACT|nr:outer membrane beta-barrel protein [Hymenobacter ginkgonis]MVN77697.1 outer membrane beta-barrel protein [Hymenobacter ginkgonis]